jgi:type IV pilus assembly protein PilC
MQFSYKALDQAGKELDGTIDAVNEDVAIASLQRRGYVISSIAAADTKGWSLNSNISFFERVKNKEVVILSRQIATLFEAQVSALRVFRLLAEEAENPVLQRSLTQIADDLQGGAAISAALGKHPKIFSDFYVNMVKSGEETGKLDETFVYLADYLDRTYEVTSKANHALIYPAFVIAVFIGVMVLLLTVVIPRIGAIITESGQEVPVYTAIVLGLSNFMVNFGVFIFAAIALAGFFLWKYSQTEVGGRYFDELKLKIPVVGNMYRKLYLSRISDNLSTMLVSGVAMVRALELTAGVVGNRLYENALKESQNDIKNGSAMSAAFSKHPEIPGIVVQMIKVGEETGELGTILKTLANFYRREVENAIDTMVGLIEPAMIVFLGVGVGVLLASVLLPIYSITTSIS